MTAVDLTIIFTTLVCVATPILLTIKKEKVKIS